VSAYFRNELSQLIGAILAQGMQLLCRIQRQLMMLNDQSG
jgi:hypothetical protein